MKTKVIRLSARYLAALRDPLKPGAKAGCASGPGLGRHAVTFGLETLDLARIHEQALTALVVPGGSARPREANVKRSGRHRDQLSAESRRLRERLRQLTHEILSGLEDERQKISRQLQDDGKSFDAGELLHAKKRQRLGLLGMRERVEMVGGAFTVESAPGQGNTIQALIPLANRRRGGGGQSTQEETPRLTH